MSLVDVDMLLMEQIRLFVSATVATELPADILPALPLVVAKQIPGSSSPLIDFGVSGAQVQIDVFAATRKGSRDLAAQVAVGLRAAWRGQVVTPAGHFTSFGEVNGPYAMPATYVPAGVHQFVVTALISAR